MSIVNSLLKHGANVVFDETETLHPLILASAQGNMAIVKGLLDAGAPVNIPGKKRSAYMSVQAEDASPMHAAVARGHLNVTRLLLSQGADIENNVEVVGTPLRVAAYKGRADILRLLLSAGAKAIDGTALSESVREGSIEIAQELLAAGSEPKPMLASACRQGRLPMVELLLEKIYDSEKPETLIDEVFAMYRLEDPVLRLLLEYASPTARRFARVCAAGSLASVKIMLNRGGIDINGQSETNGDYPLQVAASHLQAEVVRFLLFSGADVNCKSARHGTPLITALEACAASTLQRLTSDKAKNLVDQSDLPNPRGRMEYYNYLHSGSISFQQVSDCENIVRLLVIHGADITNHNRHLASPIHLACLIGSMSLVEFLLNEGADLNATTGFFEKSIFAAVQGGHPGIVALILQYAPLTTHVHPEYATPMHLACDNGDGASVRKRLEHDADATVLDAKGRTPLTIALEKKKDQRFSLEHSQIETSLEIILKLAKPLRVFDKDLVMAVDLRHGDAKTLASLLDIDKDMVVAEAVICDVLKLPFV